MSNHIFFSAVLLFLLLNSCVDTEPEAPNNYNPELLFLQADPLSVEQVIVDDQIAFRVLSPVPAFFKMALFASSPRVANGSLQNIEDQIWSYEARPSINSTIMLDDGIFADNAPVLDEAFFGCEPLVLYWGAWGWERTGNYITHSTARNQMVSTPEFSPEISLISMRTVGIRNAADTLRFPGGTARVELSFQNVGTELISEGMITISQSNLLNFSKLIPISNLPIGGCSTDTIEFTLPNNLVSNELIPFEVSFLMNDCFTDSSSFAHQVTAASYRVVKIVLEELEVGPPTRGWDPGLETETNLPDLYYRLSKVVSGDTIQLYESNVITDADTTASVVADWDDLSDTLNFALDAEYLISLFDENLPSNDTIIDEFIGFANFYPRDFFPQRRQTYTLSYRDLFFFRLYMIYP